LVGGKKYVVTLIGWIVGGKEGNASREITINEPPKNGECTAEPLEGKPLEPDFTLRCKNFKDVETPLQYEFFYWRGEGLKNETIGKGLEDIRSRVTFPSGLEKNDNDLTLYAKIFDGLGASEMVKFKSPIKVID